MINLCRTCNKPISNCSDHKIRYHTECRPSYIAIHSLKSRSIKICLVCHKKIIIPSYIVGPKAHVKIHPGKCKKRV